VAAINRTNRGRNRPCRGRPCAGALTCRRHWTLRSIWASWTLPRRWTYNTGTPSPARSTTPAGVHA